MSRGVCVTCDERIFLSFPSVRWKHWHEDQRPRDHQGLPRVGSVDQQRARDEERELEIAIQPEARAHARVHDPGQCDEPPCEDFWLRVVGLRTRRKDYDPLEDSA